MDNTPLTSVYSSKTSSVAKTTEGNFSVLVRETVEQELFVSDQSVEERITKWLSNKGVVPDDPISKQRDYFDKSKLGVLKKQELITNSSSVEDKFSVSTLGTGGSDHQNKQFGVPKLSFQPKAFGSILQRRGLKPAALDCRTPTSATTS